jgi:hypothetical protein
VIVASLLEWWFVKITGKNLSKFEKVPNGHIYDLRLSWQWV